MLLDIVILPPDKVRQKISKAVTRATKGLDVELIVDNKKLIPHLSLFHINTKKESLSKLEKTIKESILFYTPVSIYQKDLYAEGEGWFGFTLSKHRELTKLKQRLVVNCYPLKTAMMPWVHKRKPTKLERNNRSKYGVSYNIGKSFWPHFTLGQMSNEKDAKVVVVRLKGFDFSFKADTVALCEVNFWHQVTRVLKKFRI